MLSLNDFVIQTKKRKGSKVGNTFSIPISSMTDEELVDEKKKLTLQAKVGFGAPPPPFEAYFIVDGMLHVPRYYGFERFGDAETDLRCMGEEINIEFKGTLTAVQEKCINTVIKKCYSENRSRGCISVLPCGFGKTVKALKLAQLLKRKTIVFVHKTVLADQWYERIQEFLPSARIGRIQGDIFDIEDKDIVVAMVLTVAKKGFKPSDFDSFGFAIFDECHHMAARVMNSATLLLNSMYILGITATKERLDGLTQLLHWSLGPEGFRHESRTEKTKITCMMYNGNFREIFYKDNQPAMSLMLNSIAKDEKRTSFIANRMKKYMENGRTIIVLSDRITQLKTLSSMLLTLGVDEDKMGFLIGSTPKNIRSQVLERTIILCTYSMANEGLDKKHLDCLVMATPKGNCIQAVGRIQRPCENKKTPLVLDVVDNFSIFGKLSYKRRNFYNKNGYNTQVLECNNTSDEWYK